MAAIKILTLNDVADSCKLLVRHLSGAAAPVAFASPYGCRVYIAEESDKTVDDGITAAEYVGYTVGRKGYVYRFKYTLSAVDYTLDLTEDEIKMLEVINVVEGG